MSRQTLSSLKEEKSARSPLWYNGAVEDSDHEDTHSHFDLLAAASTPLRVCLDKNSIFSSPTKRLDNLRLLPRKPTLLRQGSDEIERLPRMAHIDGLGADADVSGLHDLNESEFSISILKTEGLGSGVEDDSQHDRNANVESDEGLSPPGLADQTIVEESSSDESSAEMFAHKPPPMFIRKRKHSESPMVITPQQARHPLSQSSFTGDMSGILTAESHNSTFSILKLSFSASDSTPCPPQPRKRLKFKQQSHDTPSQPSRVGRPMLDITASKKLAASAVPLLTKLNHASASDQESDDHVESTEAGSLMHSSKMEPTSTPISQSTPANSRAGSPGPIEETQDQEVNGFKFVRPATQPIYQTPVNRFTAVRTPKSQQLLNSYNTSDYSSTSRYKIIGNVPVSAAGMMDENSDDVHVGDKRINDPYAVAPTLSPSPGSRYLSAALLERYSASTDKLPILEHFQRQLSNTEMDDLINDGKSVWEFYKLILLSRLSELHMVSFLKRERLRWHPDKWVNKLDGSGFVQSNIDNLSKVINSFIEDINNGFATI